MDKRRDVISVCPECKGLGYIEENKDVRKIEPYNNMWGDVKDGEKETKIISSGKKYVRSDGLNIYDYLFLEPCPCCKGRSTTKQENIVTGIPQQFLGFDYCNFRWGSYNTDVADVKKLCDAYINNYKQFVDENFGLYIYSDVCGSGKTTLACLMARSIDIKYKKIVRFISVFDFNKALSKSQDIQSYLYYGENLKSLYECDLLIIDNISGSNATLTLQKALNDLLIKRGQGNKITIFTSNKDVGEMGYPNEMIDLITSHSYIVKLPSKNLRSERAQMEKKKLAHKIGLDL